MSKSRKIIAVVLLIVMALAFTACGQKIPNSTSEEWGLYLKQVGGTKIIVDENGKKAEGYSLDKKGNLIDSSKTIIVGAEKIASFLYVEDLAVTDLSIFSIILDSQLVERNAETGQSQTSVVRDLEPIPKTARVTLTVKPSEPTNGTVTISTDNPTMLTLLPIGEDHVDSETGVLTCTAANGQISFDMTCNTEGTAVIKCESVDGGCSIEYNVIATVNETAVNAADFEETPLQASVDDNVPQSNAIDTTPVSGTSTVIVAAEDDIPTTESTPGWINGTKANLREKTSTSSQVLETYTNGKPLTILGSASGWTKVNIDGLVGYVKSVYVTTVDPNPSASPTPAPTTAPTTSQTTSSNGRTGTAGTAGGTSGGTQNPQGTSAPVNAPIASNDGYDHGYAFSNVSSINGSSSHAHDYKLASVIEPTETSQGYSIYRCSCGSYYFADYTDYTSSSGTEKHVHSYEDTIFEPSCTEPGYTEHKCACGDTYNDTFVNALGHKFTDEEVDTENHLFKHTCTECGYTYTDEQ